MDEFGETHTVAARICERCGRDIAADEMAWKCCPKHTSERGVDAVCEACAMEMHPPRAAVEDVGT